jgi:hypothetical protein
MECCGDTKVKYTWAMKQRNKYIHNRNAMPWASVIYSAMTDKMKLHILQIVDRGIMIFNQAAWRSFSRKNIIQ